MKTISVAKSNTGCPWAGGEVREVARTEVAKLGKLVCWGSATVQFVLRLADGSEVFVKACDQPRDDERWLRKIAKRGRAMWADRAAGWRTTWIDITDAERSS